MFELLWYIPSSTIFELLDKEDKYGYNLYVRKMAKGLKVNPEVVEMHKASYSILLDLYVYKQLAECQHPPIWTIQPEWEEQKARWEWERLWNWLENRSFDSRR